MRGILPILAVMATAVTALTACDEVAIVVGGDTRKNVDKYEASRRIDSLVVRSDAGGVRVRGTRAEKPPVVTEELHYDDQKPRTSNEIQGGTLILTATCPSHGQDRCWVDYTVTVEESVEVAVQTGAGNVVVDNMTRSIEASTAAGDVRASGLAASPVTASSGAGSVVLEFVSSPEAVDATTSAGDVTVRLPDGTTYAVDAGTDVGERTVDVRIASHSRHRVRARSDVGDVSVLPVA